MFTGTVLWVVALTALLLWFPQNAQHEGAHALMAKRYGATITRFTPYPSWSTGYFTFASVAWKGGEYDARGRALISVAPQATNTAILLLLALVRFGANPSEVVVSILAGWALVNYVDGAWNLGTFYKPEPPEDRKRTDGWSFQRNMGLNKWLCRGLTAVWHVGFGALLFLAW
jgi:hypothetical protein